MTLRAAVALFVLVVWSPLLTAQTQSGNEKWVGTWATSAVGRPQTPPPPAPALQPFMANQCPAVPAPAVVTPPPGQTFAPLPFAHFSNQTLRQVIRTSVGGSRVRVVFSNAYGTAPLVIGAGSIALREKDSGVQPASIRHLTFSGRTTITIPARAVAYTDPVDLNVPPMSDVAVDVYLPGTTDTASPATMHNASFQTNYISETGNHVGKVTLPVVATMQSWFFLSRVDVLAPDATQVLVAFGDSITDGTRSTPDSNNRWPDLLVRRLLAQPSPRRLGVLNSGIAGNRVLSEGVFTAGVNALARFDSDVLTQSGVTHVVVLEGINDIGNARQNATPTADDIIAGHKQLIERARSKGLKIIGATLTPFWGAGYYTDVGEAKRQAVNEWIRTSGAYDAVVDFDRATRDANDPKKFRAEFDSCDHLHPNDAGYRAMAAAVDLSIFDSVRSTASARTR
jgi:lysophospholipase L1-like esterase